jgi:nucleoside-diphosphate-sugar epimerase
MRVVVLGGTGFIGPYVVQRLADAGHTVTVVHRGEHERELGDTVRHLHTSRSDLASRVDELGRADVALDMFPLTERDACLALDALRGRVDRLVAVSSIDVYRAYGALNRLEPSALPEPPITEESPLRTTRYPYRNAATEGELPTWLRDYDKIPVEERVLQDRDVAGTVCRLCAVYGPGDGQHRLVDIVSRIDDGRRIILLEEAQARARWPHGYVEDVAAAIATAVTDERAAGRTFNVGPPRALSLAEWTRAVGDVLEWDGEIHTVPDGALRGDDPALEPDYRHGIDLVTTRIREELDFNEVVTFAEGIKRTAAWERLFRGSGGGPGRDDYDREDRLVAGFA